MGGQTSKREMACSNLITCVQNRSPHNTIHIFSSIRTDSCQDKIANCNSYKQQGYCESMPDTMKNYCPKTCFACGELAINVFFFFFFGGYIFATFMLGHETKLFKRLYIYDPNSCRFPFVPCDRRVPAQPISTRVKVHKHLRIS